MNQQIKKAIKKIPGALQIYSMLLTAKKKCIDYAFIFRLKRYKRKTKRGCFLVFTPVHGNLGDHAIAKAEVDILNQLQIPFFEITGKQLYDLDAYKKLSLLNGRPIFINGGGILGTLWPKDDSIIRNIISSNLQSRIIIFPNTIYYDDNELGKEEYEKAKIIYGKHNHLTLYTREKQSYEVSKRLCSKIAMIPDMVLSMKNDENPYERSGCLLCLRSDIERTLSDEDRTVIMSQVRSLFRKIDSIDTVKNYTIEVAERERELESFLSEIKKAELVITDRLHGMIFCAITGTPCIVVNSKSPKVVGSYEWLKNTPYIRFCRDYHTIKDLYQDMPHGSQKFDNSSLLLLYNVLRQELKTLCS